ncbi:Uncharacterized protein Adt_18663 [Abeliophyllum distichum]|uniref:Uncharacterized protein n=1 Tax=Abeliophyllum distichum TaxID=126358 RepID=A0ABD1TKH7_9LAMI
MDDIKKILADLKSMAAYAKEEVEDIKFGMDSINEVLQQNLKLLVEISTSHAKITNDINDRIDALEAQLGSIDTKKYEQVITNEYKQVQMKEDPQCGSSSGPKRDTIVQSPRKVTINKNHTRTVRIQPDEDDEIPLSSKEEEYKNFTKVIYEIKFNDAYFISPGEHIYPRGSLLLAPSGHQTRYLLPTKRPLLANPASDMQGQLVCSGCRIEPSFFIP